MILFGKFSYVIGLFVALQEKKGHLLGMRFSFQSRDKFTSSTALLQLFATFVKTLFKKIH